MTMWRVSLLLFVVGLVVTFPLFIDALRILVFQTVPSDDYTSYLLWMVGDGGDLPRAAIASRPLSVMAAIPLYEVLPLYRFTNLGNLGAAVSDETLRATQALVCLSWLARAAMAVVIYQTARARFGATHEGAVAVFFAALLLAGYTATGGVDPLALFLVALAVAVLERPLLFAGLVVVSAFANEKVCIVLLLFLGAQALGTRGGKRHGAQALTCAVAFGVYLVVRVVWDRAGDEEQLAPAGYAGAAVTHVMRSLSFKGVVVNLFPTALFIGAAALIGRRVEALRFVVVVPVGLALIGAAVDVEYTLGRLVAHALPVLAPAAAALLAPAVAGRASLHAPPEGGAAP